MKKLIFLGLAVLLSLALITCDGLVPASQENDETLGMTDVVYSKDGSSLTIYLDGVGVKQTAANRALTRDLAIMGHDYFEVVFYDDTAPASTVRTSWEPGQAAAVKGVPRVAYGTTLALTGPNAALFVGRKSDKTLLAIGLLSGGTEANGGTHTAGTLTPNTVSVTFAINALVAGAALPGATPTSSYTGGTLKQITLYNKPFPIHQLAIVGEPIQYQLAGVSALTGYLPGIRVVAPGEAEIKIPSIALGGGISRDIPGPYTTGTTVAVATTPATGVLTSDVFTLTVTPPASPTIGSIGAVSFQIPVHAINSTAATTDGTLPVNWFIRPGFGTNRYELDEGTGNLGGSLLISLGAAPDVLNVDGTWVAATPKPVTGIAITQTGPITVNPGNSVSLNAVFTPNDATNQAVTWTKTGVAADDFTITGTGVNVIVSLSSSPTTATATTATITVTSVELSTALASIVLTVGP